MSGKKKKRKKGTVGLQIPYILKFNILDVFLLIFVMPVVKREVFHAIRACHGMVKANYCYYII